MYSSNYILSQMGIPYSDCPNQAAIDQRLNDALQIHAAVKAGVYRTKGFVSGDPEGPDAFKPENSAAETAAQITVQATIATGHVADVHAAVDTYNSYRATMGLPIFLPPSDLQILAHSHESVGLLAETLMERDPAPPILANSAAIDQLLDASNAQPAMPPQAPAVPTVAIDTQTAAMLPAGMAVTDPTGAKWIVMKTPFGSFLALASALRNFGLAAMVLLCLSLLLPVAHAQTVTAPPAPVLSPVRMACSPQPMASTKSIGEMAMGQWACWPLNDSGAPFILTPAKFYASVIQIRPVTPAVAQQIIADSINKLPQSKLVKVGQVALALGGIGATVYTGNAQWSLIVGLVSQNAPKMIQVIANEIPSAAPFTGGQLSLPVTILPGGDVPPIIVYAMRAKKETLTPFTVPLI